MSFLDQFSFADLVAYHESLNTLASVQDPPFDENEGKRLKRTQHTGWVVYNEIIRRRQALINVFNISDHICDFQNTLTNPHYKFCVICTKPENENP